MSKFLLEKSFSLDFLGDKWKEEKAHIIFNAFTIKDIKEKLPRLTSIDEGDTKSVESGITAMIELLQEKFISGVGVGGKGERIDIKAEDLEDLPVEVVSKAVNFLSQSLTEGSPKP